MRLIYHLIRYVITGQEIPYRDPIRANLSEEDKLIDEMSSAYLNGSDMQPYFKKISRTSTEKLKRSRYYEQLKNILMAVVEMRGSEGEIETSQEQLGRFLSPDEIYNWLKNSVFYWSNTNSLNAIRKMGFPKFNRRKKYSLWRERGFMYNDEIGNWKNNGNKDRQSARETDDDDSDINSSFTHRRDREDRRHDHKKHHDQNGQNRNQQRPPQHSQNQQNQQSRNQSNQGFVKNGQHQQSNKGQPNSANAGQSPFSTPKSFGSGAGITRHTNSPFSSNSEPYGGVKKLPLGIQDKAREPEKPKQKTLVFGSSASLDDGREKYTPDDYAYGRTRK